jgi:hypothetical protein
VEESLLERRRQRKPVLGGISVWIRIDPHPPLREADLAPTSLGLQMYVRCQAYTGSPANYFGLTKG